MDKLTFDRKINIDELKVLLQRKYGNTINSQDVQVYYHEMADKFNIIDKAIYKYKLLYTSQYMDFRVVDVEFKPCIELYAVNAQKLLRDDTILVRIPSFVESIDTQSWLVPELQEDLKSPTSMISFCKRVKHLKIIGNSKPLYGNLDYVSVIQVTRTPWSDTNRTAGFSTYSELETVEFESFDGSNIEQIECALFNRLKNLRYSNLDEIGLKKLSNIKDNNFSVLKRGMSFLEDIDFQDCYDLGFSFCNSMEKEIDIQKFKFGTVKQMKNMFKHCDNLETLNIGKQIKSDSSGVDIQGMMSSCEKLREMPSGIENISIGIGARAFQTCKELNEVNFSSLDLQNAIDLQYMFSLSGISGVDGHLEIDGRKFKNAKIVNGRCMLDKLSNISGLFSSCDEIVQLEIKNFELPNLRIASDVLRACYNLKKVVISNIRVGHLDDAYKAYSCGAHSNKYSLLELSDFFQSCRQLEEVIIENVKLPLVILDNLFYSCNRLRKVKLVNSEILCCISSFEMFSKCDKLECIDSTGSTIWIGELFQKQEQYNYSSTYDSFKYTQNFINVIEEYSKQIQSNVKGMSKLLLNASCLDPRNLSKFTASLGFDYDSLQSEDILHKFKEYGIQVRAHDRGKYSYITYIIQGISLENMKKLGSRIAKKQKSMQIIFTIDNENSSLDDLPKDYKLWKIMDKLSEIERIQGSCE